MKTADSDLRNRTFSLRKMLFLIAMVAVLCNTATFIFEHWYIPRKPISWRTLSTFQARQIANESSKVVILATGDWMMTGSFIDMKMRIDTPRIRQLIHEHGMTPFHADVTHDQALEDALASMCAVDELPFPALIVLRDGRRERTVLTRSFKEEEVAQAISTR